MYSRKELKRKAKAALKKHFWLYVCLCIFASIIGTDYSSSLLFIRYDSSAIEDSTVNHYSELITDLVNGDIAAGQKLADTRLQNSLNSPLKIGNIELGHAKGVFSILANNLFTGSFIIALFNTIISITKSTSAAGILLIVILAILVMGAIIFISETYKVMYARIFLEGHTYDKVSPSSIFFLFHVKKWISVSLALFRKYLYMLLWFPTVVGLFIKKYSYYLVSYILAENPTLSGKDAIQLSRKMMYGHKWECFKLEFSFIGWDIFGLLTMGLGSALFVNPYKESVMVEYYSYLRLLALENNIEGAQLLNDVYLFEKPTKDALRMAYPDITALMEEPILNYTTGNSTLDFIASTFGVVLSYDQNERQYREDMVKKTKIINSKHTIEGKSYPNRLCPIPEKEREMRLEHALYLRHYSVCSLILMFFIFAFVGWLWEVSIHLVEDHVFVNRGVLHGPWLPIYGAGGTMILIILNKFRRQPAMEFISTVCLCGVVEYVTSWYLQFIHGGEKWWDYSGYFININGRICAEGLLVFGLGGIAAVYFIAPSLDNFLARLSLKKAIIISILLACIFTADILYSHQHPNTGKGITDYALCDTFTDLPCSEHILHTRNI